MCIASHLGLTKHGSDGAGGTMHGRRAPADAASRRLCRSRPRTIGLRHFPRRAAAEQKAQQLFVRDVAELALDEVQLLMILVLGLEVERFQ